MDIIVPDTRAPAHHPTGKVVAAGRGAGVTGFVGTMLLFAMIFSEGEVHFPHVQMLVTLLAGAFLGFVLSWRYLRLGAGLLVLAVIAAIVFTPVKLLEWRLYFYLVEGVLLLAGLLLLFSPRAAQA